jgi:hypothetical protein
MHAGHYSVVHANEGKSRTLNYPPGSVSPNHLESKIGYLLGLAQLDSLEHDRRSMILFEKTYPTAKQDWHDMQDHLVEETCTQALLRQVSAKNSDVLALCSILCERNGSRDGL